MSKKVWVVPYAYAEKGVGVMALQGVEVFDSKGKAEKFVEELKSEHSYREERLNLFIRRVEVK